MANQRLREYNRELQEINRLLEQQERMVDNIISRANSTTTKEQLEYRRY